MGMARTIRYRRLAAGFPSRAGVSAFAGCRPSIFDIPPEQLADRMDSTVVASVHVGDAGTLTVLGSTVALSATARDRSGTVLVDRSFVWAMDTTGMVSGAPARRSEATGRTADVREEDPR